MIFQLAQTTGTYLELAWPLAGVVVFASVLLAVLAVVRKRMNSPVELGGDFSLSSLRKLHKEGKLTDEEFARAKGKMVATTHKNIASQSPRSPDDASPPAAEPKLPD